LAKLIFLMLRPLASAVGRLSVQRPLDFAGQAVWSSGVGR